LPGLQRDVAPVERSVGLDWLVCPPKKDFFALGENDPLPSIDRGTQVLPGTRKKAQQ